MNQFLKIIFYKLRDLRDSVVNVPSFWTVSRLRRAELELRSPRDASITKTLSNLSLRGSVLRPLYNTVEPQIDSLMPNVLLELQSMSYSDSKDSTQEEYMKRSWVTNLVLALLCVWPYALIAQMQEAGPKERPKIPPFQVRAAVSEIKTDGVLDEEAWKNAVVIPLPYEWTPGDNVPPPVNTDCLVTYDKDHFYIAFRAHDPDPGAIRAHIMDRDSIDTFIQDDHIGIMIDPFNDERRGVQLRVNPLGIQADAVFSEQDGIEDWSWDIIWNSAGKINERGYVVEIAIPFNQLRFPRTAGVQTWGFEAFRSWPRNVRHRMSSRWTDRNASCVLCQENKIVGLQGITPGRNLEFDPTLTTDRTERLNDFPGGDLQSEGWDAEPGLTARWGLTPNLTLNGTLNPAFSQVA